ncbi:MAG TPA: helix-turn-helix domain-containing protein [Candidatus Borkfalkia excrementigallinarum]|uniref:Helix-turn-helix domain-containing protein n=1 Tax=Candidatus Borkfalkia excrementigallinarum TaxID=2838506 RepID=A0A9D1ZX12_9FIRM|nr:helix-turn-helix domain-containing protein [Candidatus Borkfalkia excrementigallinarum]
MDFGIRLKELRKERKVTQKELANALGCSQSMVAQWESHKNKPTEDFIVKTAKYFDVSTDYMLGLID